jgi:DNA-binding protein HU-beta
MAIVSKSELAAELAQHSGLGSGEAKLAVEKVFELIAARLAAGDEVNVAGFGKFSVAARAARQGRSPQTGETIQIAASNAPKFSAAGALKSAVNA